MVHEMRFLSVENSINIDIIWHMLDNLDSIHVRALIYLTAMTYDNMGTPF